ncbi:MAG TPA: M48 family metalloprotease [Xanthobacteraceae bacterium]|jgi:predicted Zn-dependent protease|nr:M48 family metalloprotease [Xanthobacteraceae bacterium]
MPAARAVAILTAVGLAAASSPVRAQPRPENVGVPLIRDAEIEQLLRDYTTPILRAAGLGPQNVQVVIINNRAFNAFVMDGRRIFVNSGALFDSTTPNQIIGVLAHESGHIAGGHLAKMRQEMANAQTQMILATVLGLGAVVAGAKTGAGQAASQIGMAALTGPQEMIRRSLLSYVRAQEEQADKAGVKFLAATGQSAKGMYDTFRRFADQTMFTARGVDPYVQSHPMPAERVRALEEVARTSPYWDKKDPSELQLRHDMMRAKLAGFMDRPDTITRRYPTSDASLPARYARAISAYRFSDLRNAIGQIDALIAAQPNNPYFHELKGQALMESGRGAEAVAPLRRAAALAPHAQLIRALLAQALVSTHDAKHADEAIAILRDVLIHEKELVSGYRELAMAYGQKGDLAQADLASAQASFASGDFKTARELAARAKTRLPTGSPGWVKADDIATYRPKSAKEIQ